MAGLRVIAGKAKGLKLRSVPGDSTRPITDRAKEALFNIIGSDISKAAFLDLFAGTGSVGIEALSRGAAYARFLDTDHRAIDTIKANLDTTGLHSAAEVLKKDAFTMLRENADRAFDYAFIAPPQYQNVWKSALIQLDHNSPWLTGDAWVIAQIHPIEYENVSLHNLTEFDQRHYGSVQFVFYVRSEHESQGGNE